MKISGVYLILQISSRKCYIGSSVNIRSRWATHKRYLRKNSHDNMHLQNSWNKYGENSFTFSILEEGIGTNQLEEKENEYIEKYYGIDRTIYVFDRSKGFNTQWAGRTGCVDPTKCKNGKNHPNFGKPNYRKDKTFEELFGEQRAKELRENISKIQTGRPSPKKYKHKHQWEEMSYNRKYKLWKNNDPMVPVGWIPARMRENS